MNNTTNIINSIPLLDLHQEYEDIMPDIKLAIDKVLEKKAFINGPDIKELEKECADYCQTKHAIGVSSGTDALLLALMAMGIGEGDEVITTSFSFFATAGSIARTGATPVFVDINPDTYNIDVNLIESKITSKTKVIMPVHLFGQMANMDAIMALADKYNLLVIEDAAQAIGSSYVDKKGNVRKAGSVGHIGCFSFFPSKNLGAMGDGGLVTCQSDEIAEKLSIFKNHGSKPKYYHHYIGGNFRLDTIQAAILRVKLPLLENQHNSRIKNADYYFQNLKNIKLPFIEKHNRSIFNQFTLYYEKRDELMKALKDANIGHAIYYPVPLHLQSCFSHLNYKLGDCPVSEDCAEKVVSIPIFPKLNNDQKDYIIKTIHDFLAN